MIRYCRNPSDSNGGMPELPEIVVISGQMDKALRGKTIERVSVFQPKCLNRPEADYHRHLPGKKIESVRPWGKWIHSDLSGHHRFLVSLGMGGEICHLRPDERPPEKSRFVLRFTDRTGFYVTLWWFGYVHLVLDGEAHGMTDLLGPDPLKLKKQEFVSLLRGRKGNIKSFLLNQKRIRGIGNYYIQEILFQSRLHPARALSSLSREEREWLFDSIRNVFRESIRRGSSDYELDFFGKKGHYSLDRMAFAYRENASCPVCRTRVVKIRTGTTSQFVCPRCQTE